MTEKIIKSRLRVKKFAEVYTPEWLVKDMCSLVPEWKIEQTVLEPACGNGNFLVEVLQRKLALCKTSDDLLKAVQSIYGVDIQADNVVEAKARMYSLIMESNLPHNALEITTVLNCNIQQGDFLKGEKANGEPLLFIDWSEN